MARQGDLDFPEMPEAVRQELSEALLEVADTFNVLIQRLFTNGAGAADSRAATYEADGHAGVVSHGVDPVVTASRSLLFSALAGLDHLRTFALALVAEHPAFALATLTRGAVEAYARAYWMMTAPDGAGFLLRWLSGISKEYSVMLSFNPNGMLMQSTGGRVRIDALQAKVLQDIEHLTGSRKPLPVSYTTLATDLVSLFNAGARAHYSHLSGVAHGESISIQSFVGMDDQEGTFIVALPDHWGMFYIEEIFNATNIVLRELLNFMGWAESPTQPWAVACDAALVVIRREHLRVFGAEMGQMETA